jgi:hypothetical protein
MPPTLVWPIRAGLGRFSIASSLTKQALLRHNTVVHNDFDAERAIVIQLRRHRGGT